MLMARWVLQAGVQLQLHPHSPGMDAAAKEQHRGAQPRLPTGAPTQHFCPHRPQLVPNRSSRKIGKKRSQGESEGWRHPGKTAHWQQGERGVGWARGEGSGSQGHVPIPSSQPAQGTSPSGQLLEKHWETLPELLASVGGLGDSHPAYWGAQRTGVATDNNMEPAEDGTARSHGARRHLWSF